MSQIYSKLRLANTLNKSVTVTFKWITSRSLLSEYQVKQNLLLHTGIQQTKVVIGYKNY